MKNEKINIILFDGICNLCEASVKFIISHDSNDYFHFASQSSQIGRRLLKEYNLEEMDSIILIRDGIAYSHSDAALEIVRELNGFYRYLYIFRFIPKILRDTIYSLIAKYRYKIFGKKKNCIVPTSIFRDKFLD